MDIQKITSPIVQAYQAAVGVAGKAFGYTTEKVSAAAAVAGPWTVWGAKETVLWSTNIAIVAGVAGLGKIAVTSAKDAVTAAKDKNAKTTVLASYNAAIAVLTAAALTKYVVDGNSVVRKWIGL